MTTHLLDLGVDDVHVPSAQRSKPMAEITSKQRNALPKDEFADPSARAYPIHDKAHADNAAARLEQQKSSMSPAKYRQIKARITAAQKRFGEKPKGVKRRLHVRADLADGGSLHVSHHVMSDRVVQLDGVAVTLSDEDGKPVWIQIAKPGTFRGHPAGPFTMNRQTFEEIVRNFKATENQSVPIDFEHASESEPTAGTIPALGAPAQGWIRDMRIGDDGNLYGLVEWGDLARDYIKRGMYKFFSPAIRFGSRDRVTGASVGARMTSGALTNNPFLDGMKPLAAKDAAVEMRAALAHAPHEYMPAIRAALRMPELCSARECSDMLGTLRDHLDAVDGDHEAMHEGIRLADYLKPLRDLTGAQPGATWDEVFDTVEDLIHAAIGEHEVEEHGGDGDGAEMTDEDDGADMTDASTETTTMTDATKLKDLETSNATLSLQLKDANAKIAEQETELKTLRDEKAARDEKDLRDEVEVAFATYKDAKKLSDADKEQMLVVCKAAPEAFRKLYPRVAPEQTHLQRNLTDKREITPPAQVVDAPLPDGIRLTDSGRPETLSEHTTRVMKEKGLSFPAAQNLAIKQRRGVSR